MSHIDKGLPNELRKGLKGMAEKVAVRARRKVPVLTGRAQRSIRAGASGSSAYVKGGGARVPYYGWLEFGGSITKGKVVRDRVAGGRYLYPAADESRVEIEAEASEVVNKVLKQAGF